MEGNGIDETPSAVHQGKNAGTDQMGGWVGPTAGLDVLEKGYVYFT
jgi:hypothetical protein